ncbi:MAG: NADH-quinone oxidoreductase subunit N [Thermoplasmata archaeon]
MVAIPVGAYLPEVLLLAGALLIFLLDTLKFRRLEVMGGIASAVTAGSLLFVVADLGFAPLSAIRTLPASAVNLPLSASGLFGFTSLGLIFQAVFLTTALLVTLASLSRDSHERGAAIFFGLLLIATLGMLLVALATDLIFLLLAVEVTSISTYLMVGYTRRDARGIEAAMKFYIVGALSTALSFFGASLLFGAYGGTSFAVLGSSTSTLGYPALALAGYAFLLVGLGFKVTAVPFHAWAVDVYDGAPTDVSAFLAGGSKKMGIFAYFLVFLGPILALKAVSTGVFGSGTIDFSASLQVAFAVLAVLTMTIGNVLALLQREMKRMLAYSSISQAGYMLIGLALGTAPGIAGATFQVFAHVFMKTGAFLVVGAVAGLGIGPLITDWKGLGTRRPYLSAAFALMLLSLAGIPLTVGFVSKFILFSAAVEAEGLFVWLAVVGLLNSALSVFYYARVLKVMYMDRAETTPGESPATAGVQGASGETGLAWGGIGLGRGFAILLATVAIVAFGIYPQPVIGAIQAAAAHFIALGA